jgi:hypothetical protein
VNDDLRPLRERLHLPFWHRADIEQELCSHLDEVTDELMAQGVEPGEARRQAAKRLGDLTHVGEELQAVHHGWMGGDTVRARLTKLVFAGLAACLLLLGWYSVARQQTMSSAVSPWSSLELSAHDATDAKSFGWTLSNWQRTTKLPVVWSGIVDDQGRLVWGETKGLPLGEPFSEAGIFLPRGISSTGQVEAIRTGGRKSPGFVPLVKRLDDAGVHASLFYGQPLGKRGYTGKPVGIAIVAVGRPLWGQRLLALATNSTFWYILLWLLSAVSIFLHIRRSDPWSARIWAVFAVLTGPLAWLAYLTLLRLGYVRRPQGRLVQKATLVPAMALVATLLLLARPTAAVPTGLLDLYAFQPDRGAQTLVASDAGRHLLFGAVGAKDPRVKHAAILQLERVAGTAGFAPQYVPSWQRMLKGDDPALGKVGFLALYVLSSKCGDRVSAADLVDTWKAALGSDEEETRNMAWSNLSTAAETNARWLVRLKPYIKELLSIVESHPDLKPWRYEQVFAWAVRQGVPDLNPDDYGIPPERQQGMLPVAGATVEHSDFSIGETGDGYVDIQPRTVGGKLPDPPYRVSTSCPDLEAWVTRWPDKPDSPPIIYYAFTSRGPEAEHKEQIYLTGANGSRIGMFSIIWTEKSRKLAHCPLWEASRPERERRLAHLGGAGRRLRDRLGDAVAGVGERRLRRGQEQQSG